MNAEDLYCREPKAETVSSRRQAHRPWAAELKKACETARADLHDRELVIEVKNITAIGQEGENVLLTLMGDGVKLRACGVFTKQVLKQLTRRARRGTQERNS